MDKIRESKKYNDKEQLRDNDNVSYFKRDNFAQREMHDAVCSECGNACKVPFVPIPGRPIYCRDCFQKRKQF